METNILVNVLFFLNMLGAEPADLSAFNLQGEVHQLTQTVYMLQNESEEAAIKPENIWKQEVFVFDKDGYLTQEHISGNDKIVDFVSYELDENKKLTEKTASDREVEVKYTHFKTDEKGDVNFDMIANGELQGTIRNSFENERLTEILVKDAEQNMSRRIQISYGEDSRDIKIFESNGFLSMIIKEDNKGNQLNSRTVTDSEGNVFMKEIFERNEQGYEIKQTTEYASSEYQNSRDFQYEYDSKGNWIKKTTKDQNGDIIEVTIREIGYY